MQQHIALLEVTLGQETRVAQKKHTHTEGTGKTTPQDSHLLILVLKAVQAMVVCFECGQMGHRRADCVRATLTSSGD